MNQRIRRIVELARHERAGLASNLFSRPHRTAHAFNRRGQANFGPKAGKEAYVEPVVEDGGYRFTVKVGNLPDQVVAKGMELFRDRVLPHVRDL